MSRRKLTPEEQELWRKVAKTAERLHPEPAASKTTTSEFKKAVARPKASLKTFQVGSTAAVKPSKLQTVAPLSDQISRLPVAMDHKSYGKMRRGKLQPEARIDLHGMTLSQAQPALTGFILRAHSQGKRLVLVITGKGKETLDEGPIPVRRGVLRHAVPQWLRSSPLAPLVLQISEAHAKHGGGGAYYVYLRRLR